MGEIIPFRPRNKEKAVTTGSSRPHKPLARLKTDAVVTSSDREAGKSFIIVPTLRDLYDETRIMLSFAQGVPEAGVPVADLRKALTEGTEFEGLDRKNELAKLEEHLAIARGECIVANIPPGIRRKSALIDLAKSTYLTALEIDSDSLQKGAIEILVKVVGAQEAHTVIENIRIKRDIENKQKQ